MFSIVSVLEVLEGCNIMKQRIISFKWEKISFAQDVKFYTNKKDDNIKTTNNFRFLANPPPNKMLSLMVR